MELELGNRTALVFGGGGGLGSAIAAGLAREGCRVAVADIAADAGVATADRIRTSGGNAIARTWDLADLDTVDTHLDAIRAVFGAIDIVVHNTGGPPPSTAGGVEAAAWQRYFGSMVLPVIAITDKLLPSMRDRRFGRVITSTSSGVIAPIPNLGISNTLRGSLLGWSKTLAREVARDGITCNVLVPGRIATARVATLDAKRAEREGRSAEQVSAESAESIPMGRYGKPEEYADAAVFLASARASYVTGSVLRVDGGLIASV